MTKEYISRVVPTEAMSMTSLGFRTYQEGQVVHEPTGEVAWRSALYGEARSARLQANRMLPRYQHHLQTTGRRFEVEQREAKAERKAAEAAAVAARRATREKAGDLLAVVNAVMVWRDQPDRLDAILADAAELVASLSYPAMPGAEVAA